jgi:acetyl coenzyme A synthetase (ADP forming)-like protein
MIDLLTPPEAPAHGRATIDLAHPDGGLEPLLAPRTIAVIGASRRTDTIGHQLTRNLAAHGFTGAVFPVNPGADAVCSIKAYSTIADVPERVDMAMIVVPRQHVVSVAEQCGTAGVRSLVVISAGFREIGAEGAVREQELLDVVRRHGMRMIGPNCMGVINTHPDVRMNATFAPAMPPFGHAAFVSQSGALGVSVLDYAREYGIGISQFVSVGNKADVSGNDLLLQWERDADVRVILMYVENFGNPLRFLEIARRITRTKPIIVVKSGRSSAGARAASSHTGALAASDVAVDTLLAQAGVLRATSIEELFDMAMAFGVRQAPASRRTAVLTNAGGPGILAADALETCGLDVVELAPTTVDALRPLFPSEASIRNPLDMIASATPAGYRAALTTILADPTVDAVVPIFVPPFGIRQEEVAEAIVAASATRPEKPVLAVLMGRDGLPQGRAELHAAGIPAYIFPESAARALAALNRQREWAERPPSSDAPLAVDRDAAAAILARARREGRERLDELESLQLLGAYGVPVPSAYLARTAESAAAGATALGFPVALKVVSPDVVHKSDAGGVQLGIATAGDAVAAYRAILASVTQRVPGARIDGVLVQRMAPRGRELIAGVARDRDFGALVMFGLGGIFVEALRDVVFRVAPVETREAGEMLDGIRGARVLAGMRGEPAIDRHAVIDVLRRIGQLAVDFPEIVELDVNPLMGYERGVMAADARVRLQ